MFIRRNCSYYSLGLVRCEVMECLCACAGRPVSGRCQCWHYGL